MHTIWYILYIDGTAPRVLHCRYGGDGDGIPAECAHSICIHSTIWHIKRQLIHHFGRLGLGYSCCLSRRRAPKTCSHRRRAENANDALCSMHTDQHHHQQQQQEEHTYQRYTKSPSSIFHPGFVDIRNTHERLAQCLSGVVAVVVVSKMQAEADTTCIPCRVVSVISLVGLASARLQNSLQNICSANIYLTALSTLSVSGRSSSSSNAMLGDGKGGGESAHALMESARAEST